MSKRKKAQEILRSDLTAKADTYSAWLFVIILAVLPLLLRGVVSEFIAPGIFSAVIGSGLHGEMFTYYRWIFLMSTGVILVALLLYKMLALHYEIGPSYINMPVLVLVILILMSGLAAEYKGVAWMGMYNQREGTLTYLAYLTLFFSAANTIFKPWFAKWTGAVLIVITFINMGITLLSLVGHDISQFQFIKNLIVPAALQPYMSGYIQSSLGHGNYASGLAAALFVFLLVYTLLDTRLKQRLIYGLATLAAFVMMLASLSSGGFVTIIAVSPLLIGVAWLSSDRKGASTAGGVTLLLCCGIFLAMNAYNPKIGQESVGFFTSALPSESQLSPVDSDQLTVDKDLNQGDYQQQPINNAPSRAATNAPSSAAAGVDSTTDIFDLPSPGWSPGTGRLYIWGEVVKLIQSRPWLGYGLDTLSYHFPQNDINKIAGMNQYNVLITKPHNFYLGVAYGAGIPALLALLALFLLHFYHTGRRLLSASRDANMIFPTALFLFFCAFAVQWLFNDSVVGSAPIFWILMGAGVYLNKDG